MNRPPAAGQRIALFGGSFDPPHLGHIAIARAARQALQLDRILFAPVALQPLKPTGPSASFDDRLAMTRLAIAGDPSFEISLLDAPHPASADSAPNFTFDTLTLLKGSLAPDARLFLLLGADSYLSLHHWHRAAEIPFLANLIVASRPATSAPGSNQGGQGDPDLTDPARCLPAGLTLHPEPDQPHRYRVTNPAEQESQLVILPDLNYDISATQLRNQIRDQIEPQSDAQRSLLDPAVLHYIQQNHLYQ